MFSTHLGLEALWILRLFLQHVVSISFMDPKLHELFLYLQAIGGQREPSTLRQRPSFERHHW
jgi:hypothetical protein